MKYDKHKQGYFNVNDLKGVAKDLGEKVDDDMLEEMIKRISKNNDGKVFFEDFYQGMTGRLY